MKFKAIKPGVFRKLGKQECRVLLIRHEEYEKNITTENAIKRLIRQGQALKRAGIKISNAYSSPADRVIIAVYYTKVGLDAAGYTLTVDRLADLASTNPVLVNRIKSEARKANVPFAEYLFRLCKEVKEIAHLMWQRGHEGAEVIWQMASNKGGQTIIVGSHGGTRIEVIIAALKGNLKEDNIEMPKVFVQKGQITELILNVRKTKLVAVNYLKPSK